VAAATSAFMIGVTAARPSSSTSRAATWCSPSRPPSRSGRLPGSLAGARLGQRVEARALKIFMAAVLLLVGGRMALEAL
jgi:uncharacterized membrane protein YfcA